MKKLKICGKREKINAIQIISDLGVDFCIGASCDTAVVQLRGFTAALEPCILYRNENYIFEIRGARTQQAI